MKNLIIKCLAIMSVAMTLGLGSSGASAYWHHGYWHHGYGYWHPGVRVYYHPYYNGYGRCGWVRGHWQYGYWVPGHRACW